MKTVADRIATIQERIHTAASAAGRDPSTITLIAVSKTHPADRVREAVAAGLTHFGENRVQEARDKALATEDLPIQWHMIGHLQKNKVAPAARFFHVIHSLDSVELARRLQRALERENRWMDAFVQVKLSPEETKTGLHPDMLVETVKAVRKLNRIRLVGLMTMPPYHPDPEHSRPVFARARALLASLNDNLFPDQPLHGLSMGMSHDFAVAIAEGATHIRIGTAIFGEREYDHP